MKNVLIVTNFNAGRKKAIKYKKTVLDFLIRRCKMFKFATIEELDNIDFNLFDTIIAMGGDGTVNKVLPNLVNTEKVLGIIPSGTANLLASRLGISSNLKKSLKIIEKQNIKEIDALNINGNLCSLRFGIGYDANIISKTPQSLKNKYGYLAYFIAGIIYALRLKNKNYEITYDNITIQEEASGIIVANAANMYKNLVSIGKKSKPDDGIIDIFILKTSNPLLFLLEFNKILLNIKYDSSIAKYIKAKSINIKNNWLACHIDGEARKLKNDIQIDILPKTIKVYSK